VPSFKSGTKRESKEFVGKVGSAVVKAARSNPKNLEVEKYDYTNPKPGRTELQIKMKWQGAVTKQKFTSDITLIIDSTNKENWEVVNIEYKDSNKLPRPGSDKRIQDLRKKLNK